MVLAITEMEGRLIQVIQRFINMPSAILIWYKSIQIWRWRQDSLSKRDVVLLQNVSWGFVLSE